MLTEDISDICVPLNKGKGKSTEQACIRNSA